MLWRDYEISFIFHRAGFDRSYVLSSLDWVCSVYSDFGKDDMTTEFNVNEISGAIEHGSSVRVSMKNGSVLIINTDKSDDRNSVFDFFIHYAFLNKELK